MSIQVFISHSKGISTTFAKSLYEWISDSPLGVTPWASFEPEDLSQGEGDQEFIRNSAKRSDLCVCVLEPKNITSSWINFEAGLFYGKRTDSKKIVFTMLIGGLKYNDLTKKSSHPLSQIYHCFPNEKDSLRNFLITIYKDHFHEDPDNKDHSSKKLESINRFIDSESTKEFIKMVPS